MSKRLILILTLAFVVGISFAAYAEVQNIKVSGDLGMSAIARNNFNLAEDTGDEQQDNESMFISQLRLRLDADLTDNVSTTVRLLNERNWDTQGTDNSDINVDLAYVTLKEFLYSPLTVTLGRQEIKFGNGLIIGNARNYNATNFAGVPSDLTLSKAFDAIRATLDYNPLVVDLIYSKVEENTNRGASNTPQNDDRDLYGMNIAYDLRRDLKLETYLFYTKDSNDGDAANTDKSDKVYTFGTLLSSTPMDNLKASAEVAYQWGHRRVATGESDYKAWAFQPMLTYDIRGTRLDKYVPQVGLSYTYLSGNKVTDDSDFQLWNTMFYDQALNNITYAIIPFSNLEVINLKGSMKPMDDVTLKLNYGYYRLAQKATTLTAPFVDADGNSYGTYTLKGEKDLGSALDITAVYDYNEDVQFGLTTGLFLPGRAFDSSTGGDSKATQIIGSMKVTF